MFLELSNIELYLVREALLDVLVNSNNFNNTENKYLQEIYDRIVEWEEFNQDE